MATLKHVQLSICRQFMRKVRKQSSNKGFIMNYLLRSIICSKAQPSIWPQEENHLNYQQ